MDSYADFLQGLLDSLEPPVGVAGFPICGYVALGDFFAAALARSA